MAVFDNGLSFEFYTSVILIGNTNLLLHTFMMIIVVKSENFISISHTSIYK